MKTLPMIIRFWGLCDFSTVLLYVVISIANYHMPFYYDIKQSAELTASYGAPTPIYLAVIFAVVYVSFLYSGYLLFRRRILGAFVAYIQTPFRLMLVTPSLFFILWPLKYLFESPQVVLGMILMLISEGAKLGTVIAWHRWSKRIKVAAV